ncbi:MAG: hypothetical protein GY861_22865, partial [bacterium]|nr:hypothetical protein [bacterium]
MLRWRVEIFNFETVGGSLQFVYNKGAQNHVADTLSRGSVDSPEPTQAEEELWVASSRALFQKMEDSEKKTCAMVKRSPRLENEFHFPDTKSVPAIIRKWQAEDPCSQAGLSYVNEGKFPEDEQMYKWIRTVGDQLELDEDGILTRCSSNIKHGEIIYGPRQIFVPE